MQEVLEHLRKIHFYYLLSFGLLLAILILDEDLKYSKALSQVDTINAIINLVNSRPTVTLHSDPSSTQHSGSWEDNFLARSAATRHRNLSEEISHGFYSDTVGKVFCVTHKKGEKHETYPLFNLESSNTGGSLYILEKHLETPAGIFKTLSQFKKYWSSLDEILLIIPFYHAPIDVADHRYDVLANEFSTNISLEKDCPWPKHDPDTLEFYPKRHYVINRLGQRTEISDDPNSASALEKKYGKRWFADYFNNKIVAHFSIVDPDDGQVVYNVTTPAISGYIAIDNMQESVLNELNIKEIVPTSINSMLPELAELSKGFEEVEFEVLKRILEARKLDSGRKLDAFGVSISYDPLRNWGVCLVILIQLYFLAHLDNLRSVIALKKEVLFAPWVGIYKSRIGKLLFFLSVVVFPVIVVSVWQWHQFSYERTNLYSIILSLIASLLMVMLAVKLQLIHRDLHKN